MFKAIILPEAKNDLVDIFRYVRIHDSLIKSNTLIDHLEEKCRTLELTPDRGHYVPELQRVHVSLFREIHFKPYRIIYQIAEHQVCIHAVLDGRRDLQDLLERRILRISQ